MADKILVRRGLKVNLPVLDEGELGFCTDTKELFIGSNAGNVLINQNGVAVLPNVTGLVATGNTTDSIALSWNSVTEATSYDVLVDSELFQNVTGTSINVTGLNANTEYTLTVRAKNATQQATGIGINASTAADVSEAIIVTSGLSHYYNALDGIKSGNVLRNLAPSATAQNMTVTGGTVNADGSIYMDGTDYLGFDNTGSAYYNNPSQPLTVELFFKSRTTTALPSSQILGSSVFIGSFDWGNLYVEGIYADETYASGAVTAYPALFDTTADFFLTVTYDGSNIIIFRNGVAELNVATTQPVSLSTAAYPNFDVLSAGTDIQGFPSDFHLCRIYDRVLSDTEIAQNLDAGKVIGLSGGTTEPPTNPPDETGDPIDEGIVTANQSVKTWVGGIE